MDDADHVDGAAIGQQADMVRMSVDVSCSDAPQVLVRTHDGCRRCAGNTKERHTCGKRRAPPQGVAAASRPSRQRTGKTDESRSATVILLPTESTIDMADNSPPALLSFEVNMPGQQQIETVSERPDASREEDDDDVTLESNEERLDALGESNAMSVEGGEDDSDVFTFTFHHPAVSWNWESGTGVGTLILLAWVRELVCGINGRPRRPSGPVSRTAAAHRRQDARICTGPPPPRTTAHTHPQLQMKSAP